MNSDFRHDARPDQTQTPLECLIEDVSGCTVIHVSGEVDLATGHIFNKALNSAIAARRPIIVDFSATKYIDSSGIQVLLDAKERHQQTPAVAALAPTPKRVFEIIEIHKVISVYDTLDAAVSTVCTPSSASESPRS
jgi:anti-anti-sigma factor